MKKTIAAILAGALCLTAPDRLRRQQDRQRCS